MCTFVGSKTTGKTDYQRVFGKDLPESVAGRALLECLGLLSDAPVGLADALDALWARALNYLYLPPYVYRGNELPPARPVWLTEALFGLHALGLVGVAERALSGYDGLLSFSVHGFLDDIPRYMAAADLVLGKPGGLTTSEALAAGLPFAVVSPYPLQEEANANFLLEHGVGLRLEPLTLVPYKLRTFFADDARRARMQGAAFALAQPDAAETVVRSLLDAGLKVLIDQDRANGYGVSQGGFETGISTIAAPVFNDRGEVTAAVSIAVPAQKINDTELADLVEHVKTAAAQLTDLISHLPNRGGWPQKAHEKKAA